VIRGRIDAIFRGDGVELVDWKTGRRGDPLPGGPDQLGIYALALRQLGELPEAGCLASYCYLGGDQPVIDSRALGPAELDEQYALLEATLADLAAGDYRRACHRPDCDTCRRG
jgi:RecB family exonuclease